MVKKFHQVQGNDFNWKPCMICGGELTQEREAFFVCINCKSSYIADAKDMKQ